MLGIWDDFRSDEFLLQKVGTFIRSSKISSVSVQKY